MKKLMLKSGWLLALLLGFALSAAQAQLLLPNAKPIVIDMDPDDIDPELLINNYTENGRSRTITGEDCRTANPCHGGVFTVDLHNPQVVESGANIQFDVRVRFEQPPDNDPGMLAVGDLGNIMTAISYNVHMNPPILPGGAPFSRTSSANLALATERCRYRNNGLVTNSNWTIRQINPVANAGIITGSYSDIRNPFSPNGEPGASPSDLQTIIDQGRPPTAPEFDTINTFKCDLRGNTSVPLQLALNAFTYNGSAQRTEAPDPDDPAGDPVGRSITISVRSGSQYWYFPLDGAPSILDAELGNAIVTVNGSREFYMDLTFSEAVRTNNDGTGAVTLADFPASMFAAMLIDGSDHSTQVPATDASDNAIAPTPFTAGPTRITEPDGTPVTESSEVVRLFFPASQYPGTLVADSSDATASVQLRGIQITPPTTALIFDSEATANALHSGSDWNLIVRHDPLAPYITEASVGSASQYIDVTFSEAVRFDITTAATFGDTSTANTTPTTTQTPPAPEDFEIVHHDVSAGTSITLRSSHVEVRTTDTDNDVLSARLVLPLGDYASEDSFDVRIAEQVKETKYPSMASVFTKDANKLKGSSRFPRTAAAAQVGGLPARGKEIYELAFTTISATDRDNIPELVDASIVDSNGDRTTASARPEGGTADKVVWGMLVSRNEADQASELKLTIAPNDLTLSEAFVGQKVANADADTDPFTEITLNSDGTATEASLTFTQGTTSILIIAELTGNTDVLADGLSRALEFTISPSDPAIQQVDAASGGLVVRTIEDDDEPLVLTASDASVSPTPDEDALQTGNGFVLDDSITLTEAGSQEGVAAIYIQMKLIDTNDASTNDSTTFVGDRVNFSAANNRTPTSDSNFQNISGVRYVVANLAYGVYDSTGQPANLPEGVTPLTDLNFNSGVLRLTPFSASDEAPSLAQGTLRLLTVFLDNTFESDDLRDGVNAQVRISVVPPANAINNTPQEVTYDISITPSNDIEFTENNQTYDEDQSFADADARTWAAVTGLNAVEASHGLTLQRITGLTITPPHAAESVELVDASGTTLNPGDSVRVRYTPTPNGYGTATFRVVLNDNGEEVETDLITLTITAVDDPPILELPPAPAGGFAVDEDAGTPLTIPFATLSNGPREQDLAGAFPAVRILNRSGTFDVSGRDDLVTVARLDGLTSPSALVISPAAFANVNGMGTVTLRATQDGVNGRGAGPNFVDLEVPLTITPIGDATTLTLAGAPKPPLEVGGRFTLGGDLTWSDPDWDALPTNFYGDPPVAGVPRVRAGSYFEAKLVTVDSDGNPEATLADAAAKGVDIDFKGSQVDRNTDGRITRINRPFWQGFAFSVDVTTGADGVATGDIRLEGSGRVELKMTQQASLSGDTSDANTQVLRLTATQDANRNNFLGLMRLIAVSIEDNDDYPEQNRAVLYTFSDRGNDGDAIGEQTALEAQLPTDSVTLRGDAPLAIENVSLSPATWTEDQLGDFQSLFTGTPSLDITDANPGYIGSIVVTMTLEDGTEGLTSRVRQATVSSNLTTTMLDPAGANYQRTDSADGFTATFTPTGDQGTPASAEALIEALQFRLLTADMDYADIRQDDPGASAEFSIVVNPAADAPNKTVPEAITASVNITPVNDPPIGVSHLTEPLVIDEDSGPILSRLILSEVNLIETGQSRSGVTVQTVTLPPTTPECQEGATCGADLSVPTQIGNAPLSLNTSQASQGGVLQNASVSFNYRLVENRWGRHDFTITVTDNGGTDNGGENSTAFGASTSTPYSIVVNPINDPPTVMVDGGNTTTLINLVVDEGDAILSTGFEQMFEGITGGAGEEGRPTRDINIPRSTNTPEKAKEDMTGVLKQAQDAQFSSLIPSEFMLDFTGDAADVLTQEELTVRISDVPAELNGPSSVLITVFDLGGGEGSDAAKSALAAWGITITPVNDAPVVTVSGDNTVQVGGSNTLATADFRITDTDWTWLPVNAPDASAEMRAGSSVTLDLVVKDDNDMEVAEAMRTAGYARGVDLELGAAGVTRSGGKINGGSVVIGGTTFGVAAETADDAVEKYVLTKDSQSEAALRVTATQKAGEAYTDTSPDPTADNFNTQSMQIDVLQDLSKEEFEGLIRLIEASIEVGDAYDGDQREFVLMVSDIGNDGPAIGTQVAEMSDPVTAFALSSDIPITFTIPAGVQPPTVNESAQQAVSNVVALLTAAEAEAARMTLSNEEPDGEDRVDRVGAVQVVMELYDGEQLQPIVGNVTLAAPYDITAATPADLPGDFTGVETVANDDGILTGYRFTTNEDAADPVNTGVAYDDVEDLIAALRFQLTAAQNTPSRAATFTLSVRSPAPAVNRAFISQEVVVPIEAANDAPTFSQDMPLASLTEDMMESSRNAVGIYDLIETDQMPVLELVSPPRLLDSVATNVDSPEALIAEDESRIGGFFVFESDSQDSSARGTLTYQVNEDALAANKYGSIGYDLRIGDGTDRTATIRFTVHVIPQPDEVVVGVPVEGRAIPEGESGNASLFPNLAEGDEGSDTIDFQVQRIVLYQGCTDLSDSACESDTDPARIKVFERGADDFEALINTGALAGDVAALDEFVSTNGKTAWHEAVLGDREFLIDTTLADRGNFAMDSLGLGAGLQDFTGAVAMQWAFQGLQVSADGGDEVRGAVTLSTVTFRVTAANDPFEFDLREDPLSINAGTSETFVTSLSDVDVDAFVKDELGIAFPAFDAPYFSDGDTIELIISAPADADSDAKEDVANNNRFVELAMDIATITEETDVQAGTSSALATFTRDVNAEDAKAYVRAMQISVAEDAIYPSVRDVTVRITDTSDSLTTEKQFQVVGDEVPPEPPASLAVSAIAGNTEVALMWEPASDRLQETDSTPQRSLFHSTNAIETGGGLVHTIEINDVTGDGREADKQTVRFTESEQSTQGYVLSQDGGGAVRASYRLTRLVATLIPSRTYEIGLVARDRAGNGGDDGAGIEYNPVRVTLGTDLAITASELADVVGGGDQVATYCGGSDQFGDADDDGVANNLEVLLGLECRENRAGSDITFIGSSSPRIVIAAPPAATGGYHVREGVGAITRLRVSDLVHCENCVSLRAYENTNLLAVGSEDCGFDDQPGRVGNEMGDNPLCPSVGVDSDTDQRDDQLNLGSFDRQVVWVAIDALGNQATGVQNFYLQPHIGFDATVLTREQPAMGVTTAMVDAVVVVEVSGDLTAREQSFGFNFQVVDHANANAELGAGMINSSPGGGCLAPVAGVTVCRAGVVLDAPVATTEVSLVISTTPGSEPMVVPLPVSSVDFPMFPDTVALFSLGQSTATVVEVAEPEVESAFSGNVHPLFDEVSAMGTLVIPPFNMELNDERFAQVTFTVTAHRYRFNPDRPNADVEGDFDHFEQVMLEGSTQVTTQANQPSPDFMLTLAAGQELENGDTLEIRVVASSNDETVGTHVFRRLVIDAGIADADRDGVPDADHDLYPGDARRLQVYEVSSPTGTVGMVTAELRDPLQVSGPGNDVAIALGSYVHAVAVHTGRDGRTVDDDFDFSAALHRDDVGVSSLQGVSVSELPNGVFDFSIHGLANPGDVVSVLIPLLEPTQGNTQLHKFNVDEDNPDGAWQQFVAMDQDRLYSAPTPCPSIGARRQGDAEDFDPSRHAWRLADMGIVQPGDGCLLLQIQDGGVNDADGTANQVIHDPNALSPSSGGVRRSGGGGAMSPLWLLLLTLGVATAYRLRRRPQVRG